MAEALLPSGFLMVKKKKGGDRVMRKATNAMGIKQVNLMRSRGEIKRHRRREKRTKKQ